MLPRVRRDHGTPLQEFQSSGKSNSTLGHIQARILIACLGIYQAMSDWLGRRPPPKEEIVNHRRKQNSDNASNNTRKKHQSVKINTTSKTAFQTVIGSGWMSKNPARMLFSEQYNYKVISSALKIPSGQTFQSWKVVQRTSPKKYNTSTQVEGAAKTQLIPNKWTRYC